MHAENHTTRAKPDRETNKGGRRSLLSSERRGGALVVEERDQLAPEGALGRVMPSRENSSWFVALIVLVTPCATAQRSPGCDSIASGNCLVSTARTGTGVAESIHSGEIVVSAAVQGSLIHIEGAEVR